MKTRYRRIIKNDPDYLITNKGVAWSKKSGQWKKLKLTVMTKWGHLKVLGRAVHIWVLTAFVGPCPKGMECRHLDGNASNNRLDNLAWGTKEENEEDRMKHGKIRKGETHPNAKLTWAIVRKMRRMYATGNYSMGKIASIFGLGAANAILKNQAWKE